MFYCGRYVSNRGGRVGGWDELELVMVGMGSLEYDCSPESDESLRSVMIFGRKARLERRYLLASLEFVIWTHISLRLQLSPTRFFGFRAGGCS